MVHSQSTHLVSKLRARLLDSSSRIDAARACLLASRNFPRPLDARTAAAGEAALALQAESWIVLRDAETIDDWVCEELGGQDRERDLDESACRNSHRVERELRRLVRSNEIGADKVVSPRLSASVPQFCAPHRRPLDRHRRPRTGRAGRHPHGQRLLVASVERLALPRLGGVRPYLRPGRTLAGRRRLLT